MHALLHQPFVAFVNHLLAREEWARERLSPFAGRAAHIRVAPLPALRVRIADTGLLSSAADGQPDLTIDIPPGSVPGLLRHEEAAQRAITVDGDTEFAATIRFLFRNLRWDVEEDLSRLFGDILAHRMAELGRAFIDWQKSAAQRLGENLAEYVRDERHMLARREVVDAFSRDTATLRDAVARLDKRIGKQERLNAEA